MSETHKPPLPTGDNKRSHEGYARLLEASATLAWPVLAATVLVALSFAFLPGILSGELSVKLKFGDSELSVQSALDQSQRTHQSLQEQITDVRRELDELKGVQVIVGYDGMEIPADTVDRPFSSRSFRSTKSGDPRTSRKNTVLWVDEKPDENLLLISNLRNAGLEINVLTDPAPIVSAQDNNTFTYDLIIVVMNMVPELFTDDLPEFNLITKFSEQGDDEQPPILVWSLGSRGNSVLEQRLDSMPNVMVIRSQAQIWENVNSLLKY